MSVDFQFNNGDFIVFSQDPVDLSIQENNGIPRNNYYTAIPIMENLFSRGILSLGTVRLRRLPNCPLPD